MTVIENWLIRGYRIGRYRTWLSYSLSKLQLAISSKSAIASPIGVSWPTSKTPAISFPVSTRAYACFVIVVASCVSGILFSVAAHSKISGSRLPSSPASWTRTMSSVGRSRSKPRRIRLSKSSSTAKRNTFNLWDCALGGVREGRSDRTEIHSVGELDRVPVAAPSRSRQRNFGAASSS
jgi:hypothetical protein